MKRILLSSVAILALAAAYGQENELKKERLTAQFEKQWSTPDFFASSNLLDVTEIKANKYKNHIASYAPMFFDTSVKRKKPRKVLLRSYSAMAFIATHKER